MGKFLAKIKALSGGLRLVLFFGAIAAVAVATMMVNAHRDTPALLVEATSPDAEAAPEEPPPLPTPAPMIMVYVSGEVNAPGVFEFDEGARIVEAIEAAGGFTEDACRNSINLAARMVDAQHILVHNIADEIPVHQIAAAQTEPADTRININTATSAELQTLSGVGPVTAQNIINHRESRGPFETIEDIMRVTGIGERTFENLREHIRVN